MQSSVMKGTIASPDFCKARHVASSRSMIRVRSSCDAMMGSRCSIKSENNQSTNEQDGSEVESLNEQQVLPITYRPVARKKYFRCKHYVEQNSSRS